MLTDSETIMEIAQDLEGLADRAALLTRTVSPRYTHLVVDLAADVEKAQNAAETLAYEIRLMDTAT